MSAVLNNKNSALSYAHRNAPSYASSFGSWLHSLSSGLHIAGDLNQFLDNVLRGAQGAPAEMPPAELAMLAAREEVRAAERRIHALESELARMRELVCEDQLTGCLNRRGLTNVLERELARAERKKSPLCVALLDLDDFKKLNDTHGHCAGDAALVHLVRVAKATLRKTDVVGRFGGEEFMIVLPDTPLEDAVQTLARVQSELRRSVCMHLGEQVAVTFSAGVTLCGAGDDQTALVMRADAALYKAKSAGKNRVFSAE